MQETETDFQDKILGAKSAIRVQNWNTARGILTPLMARRPQSAAAFWLARVELEEGNLDAAAALLEAFLANRAEHAGALVLRARLHLMRGDTQQAARDAQTALALKPDQSAAKDILATIDALATQARARPLISLIEKADPELRRNRPSTSLIAAAAELSGMAPAPNWADDTDAAKIAFFHHAKDPESALRNYDPHLIDISVRFGYVSHPA